VWQAMYLTTEVQAVCAIKMTGGSGGWKCRAFTWNKAQLGWLCVV
jgi:hypothetical protein